MKKYLASLLLILFASSFNVYADDDKTYTFTVKNKGTTIYADDGTPPPILVKIYTDGSKVTCDFDEFSLEYGAAKTIECKLPCQRGNFHCANNNAYSFYEGAVYLGFPGKKLCYIPVDQYTTSYFYNIAQEAVNQYAGDRYNRCNPLTE